MILKADNRRAQKFSGNNKEDYNFTYSLKDKILKQITTIT